MEIEKQTDLMAGETEVREQLRFVDGFEPGDRLDLDDNRTGNEEIDSVGFIEFQLSVNKREFLLPLNRESRLCQLISKTGFIS